MFVTALRSLRAHRVRFLLPALAVVLGVAFTSGSLLYTQSVRAALAEARSAAQPDVSVAVQRDEGGASSQNTPGGAASSPPALDKRLLDRLRTVPGAAAVRGSAEGAAFVVGRDGELTGPREKAAGAGYTASEDGADARYPLSAGRGPRTAGEIALDARTARRTGHAVGDRVRVVVGGEARTARLVGTVTAHDPRLVSGGTLTLFDAATAERYFAGGAGTYTALTLTAERGTSDARLARSAQSVLPDGLRAVTRKALDAEAGAGAGGEQDKMATVLLSFGAVALFVATFLVANTFSMLSAARAREHALLRAVGAGRSYVLRLVLTEALIVGAVSAACGHLLGMGVAGVLARLFGATGAGETGVPLRFLAPEPLAAAFGVGIVVSALAAYLPARKAARVPPVAALRGGEPPAPAPLRRRNAAGAAVTALGVLLTAAASGSDDPGVVMMAGAVLMTGLILLTPAIALGATRLLRRPLTRVAGVHGTLAVENARRNPRRTAATSATLMIGLALVSAATVAAGSLGRAASDEARRSMVSDLRVTPVDFAEIGAGTAERIARLPGAEAVTPTVSTLVKLRGGGAEHGAGGDSGGGFLDATAVNPRTVARVAHLRTVEGDLGRLGHGVAVTREEARAHGWHVGSRVKGTVEGTGTRIGLPVVAVYEGPEALGPALLPVGALPRTYAGPSEQGPTLDSVLVKTQAGRTADVQDEIRRALDNPALLVQDRADAGTEAARPFTPLLNIVYALLSVAVLIGSLGVVNTMAMAVLERVRELGILRAIGLDRKRIAAVLRLESLLISLLGAALGVTSGTLLGAAAVAGQDGAPLTVPWARLALFFALAATIGVLAAAWPGRQAARVPLVRAVQADTD
ncbi:FtsX-like permease family protein [Streptomyces sp. ODS28]|uniref:ABC transporter permease n=1 Tax=Streptomyces sp. ODS28 TaxID=3136688 RepID=UPI0031E938C1